MVSATMWNTLSVLTMVSTSLSMTMGNLSRTASPIPREGKDGPSVTMNTTPSRYASMTAEGLLMTPGWSGAGTMV